MSLMSGVVERSGLTALAAGFAVREGDPELTSVTRAMPSGTLRIDTQTLVGAVGEIRMACIQSPKIDIVTVFFYPQAALALPVYAMEFVLLGTRPIVAVMDLVAPANDPAQSTALQLLTSAHQRSPALINADDAPDWYAGSRSGHDFFIRPTGREQFDELAAVHAGLWEALLAAPQPASRPALAQADFVEFVNHYKHHHKTHSPGLPLMTRSFGEAWTRRYLNECFFA